jgi:uncharacterized protein YbjT (DUF2867 family)
LVAEARAGSPLTVGVTGASGFIGGALCRFLAGSGHTAFRFVRGPATAPDEIPWNPARGQLEPRALDGLDAIVHLSGASLADGRWSVARKRELVASRVQSTATLARAIAACANPPRVLVSGSAVGGYGDRGEESLDESSALGRGFVAELVQAWEAAAAPRAMPVFASSTRAAGSCSRAAAACSRPSSSPSRSASAGRWATVARGGAGSRSRISSRRSSSPSRSRACADRSMP